MNDIDVRCTTTHYRYTWIILMYGVLLPNTRIHESYWCKVYYYLLHLYMNDIDVWCTTTQYTYTWTISMYGVLLLKTRIYEWYWCTVYFYPIQVSMNDIDVRCASTQYTYTWMILMYAVLLPNTRIHEWPTSDQTTCMYHSRSIAKCHKIWMLGFYNLDQLFVCCTHTEIFRLFG